jgi:hypothetical protein
VDPNPYPRARVRVRFRVRVTLIGSWFRVRVVGPGFSD